MAFLTAHFRYPPYADWKVARMGFLLKNRKLPPGLSLLPYLLCVVLGTALPSLINFLTNLLAQW